jgi:hypothetical protein
MLYAIYYIRRGCRCRDSAVGVEAVGIATLYTLYILHTRDSIHSETVGVETLYYI